jgi:periplasmic protein TonB
VSARDRRRAYTGRAFFLSALVHLSLMAAYLGAMPGGEPGLGGTKVVAVSLDMFEAEGGPRQEGDAADVDEQASSETAGPTTAAEQMPAAPSQRPVLADFAPPPQPVTRTAREAPPPAVKPTAAEKEVAEPAPRAPPGPPHKTSAHDPPPRTAWARRSRKLAHRPARDSAPEQATTSGGPGASGQGAGASGRACAAAEQSYLAELQRAIARHRFYPPLARRRGREGEATVAFVIQADGRLSDVRLAASSGVESLDAAAVKTLEDLGRFRPIPPEIGRTHWPLRVPISFALR